jgi:hypothetical protein
MKNLIYYTCLVALFIFSCKKGGDIIKNSKNSGVVTDNKLYPVNFNVSGFAEQRSAMGLQPNSLKTVALEDQIKYLTYYLYDSVGITTKRLKKIDKKPYFDFGLISDSLKVGTYYAFFVGSKAPGYDVIVDIRWEYSDLENHEKYFLTYGNNPIGDTFTAAIKLKVNASTNNSQAVVLKRAVARVNVKILDAIPANASKIELLIGNADPGFDLLANFGEPTVSHNEGFDDRVLTFNLKNEDKGKKNFSFSTYLFPWATTEYRLTCYDKSNNIIALKQITTPFPYASNILSLEGKLFDNPSFFTITLDDHWNQPQTVPFNIPVISSIENKSK